jgi:hypothetical protein
MKTKNLAAISVVAVLLSSCVSSGDFTKWSMPNDPIMKYAYQTPGMMAPILTFGGFQVAKPNTNRWELYFRDISSSKLVLRLKDVTKTYDAYFVCQRVAIPREPQSLEDFESIIKDEAVRILDTSRLKVLSITTHPEVLQNQWCVRYVTEIQDSRPVNSSTPLIMRDEGFFVINPAQEMTTVKAAISQRGLSDELLHALDPDMKYLLDNVVILDKKGVPIK